MISKLSLWPTNIYTEHVGTNTEIINWVQLARSLLPTDDDIAKHRGHRPWASHDVLHEDPNWGELKQYIMAVSSQVLDIEGIERREHYITSMWLNAQFQNNNHGVHTHSNCLFSGVVYLQTPINSQVLAFQDPRPQSLVLAPRTNTTTQDQQALTPRPGLLAIWPSWLPHKTHSTTYEELVEPRLTVAFNIMIHDNITTHSARAKF